MNINFLNSVTNFIKKRTIELVGLLLISISLALTVSFISYTPNDPSFVYGDQNSIIQNYLGLYGSIISDFLLQSFGIISFLLLITILSWGVILILRKKISGIIIKIFFVILYLIFGSSFIYVTYDNSFWLIDNGNSGFVGQIIYNYTYDIFPSIKNNYSNAVLIFLTTLFFFLASDFSIKKIFINSVNLFINSFRKNKTSSDSLTSSKFIDKEENIIEEKPQQSFVFEQKNYKNENISKINFKLPSIELLEIIPIKPMLPPP